MKTSSSQKDKIFQFLFRSKSQVTGLSNKVLFSSSVHSSSSFRNLKLWLSSVMIWRTGDLFRPKKTAGQKTNHFSQKKSNWAKPESPSTVSARSKNQLFKLPTKPPNLWLRTSRPLSAPKKNSILMRLNPQIKLNSYLALRLAWEIKSKTKIATPSNNSKITLLLRITTKITIISSDNNNQLPPRASKTPRPLSWKSKTPTETDLWQTTTKVVINPITRNKSYWMREKWMVVVVSALGHPENQSEPTDDYFLAISFSISLIISYPPRITELYKKKKKIK